MNKPDKSTLDKASLRTLYPMLSEEVLALAEERMRRYLTLALEILDDLSSASDIADLDQ
jgi:hypothetical protein